MKTSTFILFFIVCVTSAQWSSDTGVNLIISSGAEEGFTPMIALGTSGDSFVSWVAMGSSGLYMLHAVRCIR